MKLSTLGAVSAAFVLCAAAGAQTANAPLGASLRLGLVLPTNSSTVDDAGSSMFGFGVDYKLTKLPSIGGLSSGLGVSVDYFSRGDYSNVPLLVNYTLTKNRFSVFAGVGVAFTSLPGKNDTKFGYQAGISYDLPTASSTPLFVQAGFFGTEQSKLNGVGLYLGYRF